MPKPKSAIPPKPDTPVGPSRKRRRGGPNPGAQPRKLLLDRPWTRQLSEFESGKFGRAVEGVGFAIAAVRQFSLRLKSASPDEAATLRSAAGWPEGNPTKAAEETMEHKSGNVRCNTPERSGNAAARHVSDLGRWLAEATPENLRVLAFFLESRPIAPSPRLGGNLLPGPADPAAYAACMAIVITSFSNPETSVNPHNMPEVRAILKRASPEQIEYARTTYAPNIDATTFRKVLNQISGVKRAAGARKK
jgi:hypothetical protein